MNRLLLNGRLGKDAQVHGSPDRPIVTFSLAVNAPMAGGEHDTQWFTCTAFGFVAARLIRDLPKKGSQVTVVGKTKRKTFVDSRGIERSDVEVNVESFHTACLNRFFLIGRLVSDAQVSESSVRFTLMTLVPDEDGFSSASMEINCEASGNLAKFLKAAAPKRNALVWIDGPLRSTPSGYVLDVGRFQFLERKGAESIGGGTGAYVEEPARAPHDIWR